MRAGKLSLAQCRNPGEGVIEQAQHGTPWTAAWLAQERQSPGRFSEGASVRSKDTTRHGLSVSSDAERAVSTTWRSEHRPQNSSWHRALSSSRDQAWALFSRCAD